VTIITKSKLELRLATGLTERRVFVHWWAAFNKGMGEDVLPHLSRREAMKISRSVCAKVAAAALALAAAGTASVAQARSNVYFSVAAPVAPGVVLGVSNAPVYYPPVYSQPYYVQPAPVYYNYYDPVYVRPAPVYYRPAPVYFGATYYGHRHHRHHHRHHR
jgi:hypothetical protein